MAEQEMGHLIYYHGTLPKTIARCKFKANLLQAKNFKLFFRRIMDSYHESYYPVKEKKICFYSQFSP